MSICLLPDPGQCNTNDWLIQLRDLLCALECNLDEIQCVDCGTEPANFYTGWGGCYANNAEVPCGSIVLEQCDPVVVWIWNGSDWSLLGPDNEFRVAANGTTPNAANLNILFVDDTPNTMALVYIESTGFYYTKTAG